MDAAEGEIVALEMRNDIKKELCIDILKQPKAQYGNLTGTIFHSDRGSQYTSEAFREELAKMGMLQSLSGTGRCYDNARMEGFFATMKKEKLYSIPTTEMTRDEVRTVVFRYVFVYYNRIRIHTSNENGLPHSNAAAPKQYSLRSAMLHTENTASNLHYLCFWVFSNCTFLDISKVCGADTLSAI